ncbi:MAG: DUF3854 domain-containing protein, partial [Planctomycetes bacterium]|nr:DUF3854 domain-containing protein [Planctomycetota bacterium]
KPRDGQGRKVDDADSVPIPDLDLVTWRKRTAFLVFDSDIVRKAEVRRALWALRGELVGRGAIVRVVYLPDGKDGAKVGLDDLLVAHGADALRKVLNDAPVLDWQERVRAVLDTPEGQGRDDLIRELLVDLMREGDALTRDRVRKALVDGKALTARTFDELAKECEPKGSGSSEPGQVELTAKRPDLVDLVDAGGNVAFLVKDGDALRVLSCVDSDGLRYIPPPREKIPFPLANADEVLRCYQSDTDGKLFDDLVSYHRAISDLPEGWYGLLATWDFHTWLLEPVHYSPIIVLYAVAGRGKSRTLQGAAYVACRAIITESLRDSYLGRYTDAWGGVVCFDVMNLWDKAKRMNSEDVILQRYERGAKVPRVNKPEAGAFMDTDFYNLFGGTIIATNEPLHHILDTRALTLIMTESSRRFPDDVMPEAGMPLRARLAAFRARHLGEHLPGTEKPISGRLGDITRPLVQMVRLVKREWESELLRLIRKLDSERKAEKRDTVDGEIVAALAECEGELMADGRLAVKAVTDNVNGARQEGQGKELTSQYIGKRLRALGFAGGQRTGEGKTILFDRDLLARLLDKYGIREDAHAPTETAQ